MVEIINKFTYQKISRSSSEETGRTYVTEEGQKLPSVTTILSKTKPASEQAKLDNWKKRVGEQEANKIRDQANSLGTKFHTFLEKNLKGEGHKDLTEEGVLAEKMATLVVTNAFPYLKEVWGSEVFVHYPHLYAGQTDLIGVYKNRNCIMDFKTTNKPKREDWIKDYFYNLEPMPWRTIMYIKLRLILELYLWLVEIFSISALQLKENVSFTSNTNG
jgi:hypothetical protein